MTPYTRTQQKLPVFRDKTPNKNCYPTFLLHTALHSFYSSTGVILSTCNNIRKSKTGEVHSFQHTMLWHSPQFSEKCTLLSPFLYVGQNSNKIRIHQTKRLKNSDFKRLITAVEVHYNVFRFGAKDRSTIRKTLLPSSPREKKQGRNTTQRKTSLLTQRKYISLLHVTSV